jgi:hypothetical protein
MKINMGGQSFRSPCTLHLSPFPHNGPINAYECIFTWHYNFMLHSCSLMLKRNIWHQFHHNTLHIAHICIVHAYNTTYAYKILLKHILIMLHQCIRFLYRTSMHFTFTPQHIITYMFIIVHNPTYT